MAVRQSCSRLKEKHLKMWKTAFSSPFQRVTLKRAECILCSVLQLVKYRNHEALTENDVPFVLPAAKGLWEAFTGSSSAHGCCVVLTYQKKTSKQVASRCIPNGMLIDLVQKEIRDVNVFEKLLSKSHHPLQTVVWLNTEENVKNLPAKAFAQVLSDKLVWILFLPSEKKILLAFDINSGCLHV